MTYLLKNNEKNGKYSVVIEDDGRVAYAYLLENEDIIGDVWLYNCDPTPDEPEWDNPAKMPFLNSKNYVIENQILCDVKRESDWHIKWYCNDYVLEKVELYLKENILVAVLKPHSKPGWSCFVRKDGPLAKILKN